MLLSLARSIFEEQNNLDCLVSKIMTQARDLIKCERCVVFLLDLECEEAVRHFLAALFFFNSCPFVLVRTFHSPFSSFIEPFGTLWSEARKLFAGKEIVDQKCNKNRIPKTKIIRIQILREKTLRSFAIQCCFVLFFFFPEHRHVDRRYSNYSRTKGRLYICTQYYLHFHM